MWPERRRGPIGWRGFLVKSSPYCARSNCSPPSRAPPRNTHAPDKRDRRPEYPDMARAGLQHGFRRIKRIDVNFDLGAVGIFSREALHQAPRCRRDLAAEAGVLADIIDAVEAIREGNLG